MSFTDKIANGSAIMIIEALSPHPSSLQFAEYYRHVMVFVPGMASLCALGMLGVIVYRGKPLSTMPETPSVPSSPIASADLIQYLHAEAEAAQLQPSPS